MFSWDNIVSTRFKCLSEYFNFNHIHNHKLCFNLNYDKMSEILRKYKEVINRIYKKVLCLFLSNVES